MGSCSRCAIEISDVEYLKCDGGCGKMYHLNCAGAGSGVTKAFYKLFIENDYFIFMCTLCRKSSLKAVNEKINKVISTIAIYDERITRYNEDIKNIKQSLDDFNTVSMKSVLDTINELKLEVSKNTNENQNQNVHKFHEEVVELKKVINMNKNEITENIKKIVKEKQIKAGSSHSYADSLKKALEENVVLVKPKGVQDSLTTKEALKSKINPNTISVNGLHHVSKGGVIIKCPTKESMNDFKKAAIENLSDDYDITIPESLKPKIKIIGYNDNKTNEEIEEFLKNQNGYITENENSHVKVMKKEKCKNSRFENYNLVVEVDSTTYKNVMMNRKINIIWQRCKVVDCLDLQRCYNCSGFNHKAANCKSSKACPRCSENHPIKECKSEIEKCINCINSNKRLSMNLDTNHSVWSQNCRVHKRMLDYKRRRLDLEE